MDKTEKVIGFQRLVCKNPVCGYLLKKIYFVEGWEKRVESNGVAMVRNNGTSYYECPHCKAKNYVIEQGEKIILEKIIRVEYPQPTILT